MRFGLAATPILLLAASGVWSEPIFEETFEGFAEGEVVNSVVVGGTEVAFTADSSADFMIGSYSDKDPFFFGGALESDCRCNDPLNPDNVSGSSFLSPGNFEENGPVTFSFSMPVLSFGLTTLDLLEERGGTTDFIRLEAYSADGTLVDFQLRSGPQGSSGLDLDWLVSSSQGISYAVLTGDISDYSGWGFDDLQLQSVSVAEPGTLALLGAGLIGIGFSRKRKKA